jgi:hypothetical protein
MGQGDLCLRRRGTLCHWLSGENTTLAVGSGAVEAGEYSTPCARPQHSDGICLAAARARAVAHI